MQIGILKQMREFIKPAEWETGIVLYKPVIPTEPFPSVDLHYKSLRLLCWSLDVALIMLRTGLFGKRAYQTQAPYGNKWTESAFASSALQKNRKKSEK